MALRTAQPDLRSQDQQAADAAVAAAAATGNWEGFKTVPLCTPEGAKLIAEQRGTLDGAAFLGPILRQPFRWQEGVFRILRCEYRNGSAEVEISPDSPELVAEIKSRIEQDRFHVLPYFQGYGFIAFPEDHQKYRQ